MSHPTPSPYDPDRAGQPPYAGQQRDESSGDRHGSERPSEPPYGGQPYGGQQGGDQPYGQQPYGQQPYGQQQSWGQQQPYQGQGQGPGYSGQPYPPTYGQQYYGQQAPNNTMAVVSLIAGIAGLTLIPFVGSIVAVITGHMARRQIAESGEAGGGLATAGLITGWVGVALGVLIVVAFLLFFGALTAGFSSMSYS